MPDDTLTAVEALRGSNPWPENSDYGKFWRKGFEAGRADAVSEMLPGIEALAKQSRPEPVNEKLWFPRWRRAR